jgi:Cu2+-exporting ATPase
MEKSVGKDFPVSGMSCASCARGVENMLKKQNGVIDAAVNYAASSVRIYYDPLVTRPVEFKKAIQSIGYDIITDQREESQQKEVIRRDSVLLKRKTIFATVLTLPVVIIGMFLMDIPYANWIMLLLSTPVVFWFGRTFFINAFRQLKHRQTNMDTLVALSTSIAWVFSLINTVFPHLFGHQSGHQQVYYEASAVIIVFILLGKLLEEKARANTSSAIKKLMGLQSETVTLVSADGTETIMAMQEVRIGDYLRVRPGERIPVDGDISDGSSFIDESTITGEPVPAGRYPGDKVYAGTINQKGSFVIRARKVGGETLLARIIQKVQEAQGSKPPVQKLVDKVASVFVPVVIAVSLLSFFIWMILGGTNPFPQALLAMVSVLIIACPCALGLATPTAVMVGIGLGAEHGILIKDADGLEQAHLIDTLVLDKTGTITEGKPAVTDCLWKLDDPGILKQVLMSIEAQSEHPLAEAVIRHLKEDDLQTVKVDHFTSLTGRGVLGTVQEIQYAIGNELLMKEAGILLTSADKNIANELQEKAKTVVFFGSDNQIYAIIGIADQIKKSSVLAIKQFNKDGIEIHMLTGDNEHTAASVARETGITRFKSGLLPAEKAQYIKNLQLKGKVVAMAGDGINDSQAMAEADVSIAMGSGSDIAMDVAKMTIVSSNLGSITSAILLSKHTIRTIRQNLFWAFIYNVIGIPVAAGVLYPFTGFMLNPMIAGAAMAMSSVSVVSNSLRLKFIKFN